MRITVAIKSIPEMSEQFSLEDLLSQPIKWVINPLDEIAVEAAVRLLESGSASEVTAVSIGQDHSIDPLKHALAMGAENAILIENSSAKREIFQTSSRIIAHALAAYCRRHPCDLLLLGTESMDSGSRQVAAMTAQILSWPQACSVSQLDVVDDQNICVCRETSAGNEKIKLLLPAVVSVDQKLNEPRYLPLSGIIKARNKPLIRIPLDDFVSELPTSEDITTLEVTPLPLQIRSQTQLSSVTELATLLRKWHNLDEGLS